MKIRPFVLKDDFSAISGWIDDRKMHALWCSERFSFPLEEENFGKVLEEFAALFGDRPYLALAESGEAVGFFCFSEDTAAKEGMFKFVVVAPSQRGKGVCKQMLRLAMKEAFRSLDISSIHLNVFIDNPSAQKCYEDLGFKTRALRPNAHCYCGRPLDSRNMVIKKEQVL